MNKYEGLIILDAASNEDAIKAAVNRVSDAIKTTGGKVLNVQKLEQRPFARTATKRQSGYYVNIIFDAPSKAVGEMDTKFRLEGGLVRWQFTCREESTMPKRKHKPSEDSTSSAPTRSPGQTSTIRRMSS